MWQGEVALREGALYGLDTLPVVANGGCIECLQIKRDDRGRASFAAANGIQGWPGAGAPSYTDCILLRNKLTLDSVVLGAARTSLAAVARGGWICATGGNKNGLMRMRYDGRRGGR